MSWTDGFGNASYLELVWTILSMVSMWACLGSLRDTILDRRALHKRDNFRPDGPREVLSRGFIRSAAVRCLVQGVFVVVGIAACLTPPPIRPQNLMVSVISICLYILLAGALTYDAIFERQDRRRAEDRLWRAQAEIITETRAAVAEERAHEQDAVPPPPSPPKEHLL